MPGQSQANCQNGKNAGKTAILYHQYQRNTLPEATGSLIRASNAQDDEIPVQPIQGPRFGVSAWNEIVSQIC
jgi:hypothetical protein